MLKRYATITIVLIALVKLICVQKTEFANIKNYSYFLNHGDKLSYFKQGTLENEMVLTKVDILGEILKKNVESLKKTKELDIIFLIDGSSSVGKDNFRSELKFVKKLLSDVTVDLNHTRVGVISFSSPEYVVRMWETESNICLNYEYILVEECG